MDKGLSPAYPSLSTSGWVRGLLPIGERIFNNYLTTNYSQSNLHNGELLSLANDIRLSSNNQTNLEKNIRSSLYDAYSRYFILVEIDVKVVDDPRDDNRMKISISIVFGRDGYTADLSRTLDATWDGVSLIKQLSKVE